MLYFQRSVLLLLFQCPCTLLGFWAVGGALFYFSPQFNSLQALTAGPHVDCKRACALFVLELQHSVASSDMGLAVCGRVCWHTLPHTPMLRCWSLSYGRNGEHAASGDRARSQHDGKVHLTLHHHSDKRSNLYPATFHNITQCDSRYRAKCRYYFDCDLLWLDLVKRMWENTATVQLDPSRSLQPGKILICVRHVFQAAISALCLFLQFAACLNVAVPSLNFVARQLARINLRFAKGSWQGRCSNIQLKQARMITKYLITSWMSDLRPWSSINDELIVTKSKVRSW